jgi:hypothetical protein
LQQFRLNANLVWLITAAAVGVIVITIIAITIKVQCTHCNQNHLQPTSKKYEPNRSAPKVILNSMTSLNDAKLGEFACSN